MKLLKRGRSKQYCVCTNWAPAAIFLASRATRNSYGGANGFSAAPRNTRGGVVSFRPERNRPSSRISRRVESSEIESRSNTGFASRMVAALHAVAGETQHVADAERRRAEHRALDGDAVIVAAGNLQHRRKADAGQDRADGDARHVTMRAGAVGGVDAVDPAFESPHALMDVLGVGRVRRAQLGGDGEFAAPKHALQPAARRMAGQIDQRRRRIGAEVMRVGSGGGAHAAALVFLSASRSQVEEPFSA